MGSEISCSLVFTSVVCATLGFISTEYRSTYATPTTTTTTFTIFLVLIRIHCFCVEFMLKCSYDIEKNNSFLNIFVYIFPKFLIRIFTSINLCGFLLSQVATISCDIWKELCGDLTETETFRTFQKGLKDMGTQSNMTCLQLLTSRGFV